MVSLVDAREAIYERFRVQWGATSPYTFDNETYEPPANAAWVRVAVRHNASRLEAVGGMGYGGLNKFMRSGRVFIQVFTPVNKGTREADTLAQTARAIFEGITISSNAIRFNNAVVREIGPDGSWYQINVECAFDYDERK